MKKQITGALVTGIFLTILYGSAVHFQKVEATDTTIICENLSEGPSVAEVSEYITNGVEIREVLPVMALPVIPDLQEEENEYADLAIMNVKNYVNVRSLPSTDGEIVGKIYPHAVAQVLGRAGENEEWFQIVSGNVEGYIKAEFFLYGEDAVEEIEKNVIRYASVLADRLNVREEPSTDSKRIGYLNQGEKAKMIADEGEWIKIVYGDEKEGYVAKEYTILVEEFIYAKSIEEERAEEEAKRALAVRAQDETDSGQDILGEIVFPSDYYGSNEELRKAIVDYAMQYLGNKYVHGGSTLAGGTDCSGFTSLIYKDFGYSVSRTPGGQYTSDGRSISFEEIKPGDIICYGKSSSKCTHVALYIGDGQIIHAANSKKGVVIYEADYDTIIGIKNVID